MIPFKPEPPAPDKHPQAASWSDTPDQIPTAPYVLRHPLLLATIIEAGVAIALDRERSLQFAVTVFIWGAGTAFVYTKGESRPTLPEFTPKDRDLLDDPTDPNAAVVKMQIIQDGRVTGSDKGVLSLAEDAIFFSGHRTAFCLGVQDLRMKTVDPPKNGNLAATAVMLSLWHGKEDLRVTFEPLHDLQQEARFTQIKRVIASMAKQGGETTLERVYPPLAKGYSHRLALPRPVSYVPFSLLLLLQVLGPVFAPYRVITMIVMASFTVLALIGSKLLTVRSPEP